MGRAHNLVVLDHKLVFVDVVRADLNQFLFQLHHVVHRFMVDDSHTKLVGNVDFLLFEVHVDSVPHIQQSLHSFEVDVWGLLALSFLGHVFED